jgi:multidrug efflux pump subunit AcrA (membrane-fusion protein)
MLDLNRNPQQAGEAARSLNLAGDGRPAMGSAGLWEIISRGTAEASEFYQAWLGLQCGIVGGVTAGLLLLRTTPHPDAPPYAPAAAWPDAQQDLNQLAQVAQQAAGERRSVVARCHSGTLGQMQTTGIMVAHPIGAGGEGPFAIIAVSVGPRPGLDPQAVARQLAWGAGWLEMLLTRQRADEGAQRVARAAVGLDLLAVAGEHRQLDASAMALSNELAGRLHCDRVSIGIVNRRRNGVRLKAMSHTATFVRKSQTADSIENAMEEALDQNTVVSFPPTASTERRIAVAHKSLANAAGGRAAVASVILSSRGRSVGVITLERHRDEAFDEAAIQLCETVANLIGPMIDLQHDRGRMISGRAVDLAHDGIRRLFGPRYPALKLAAGALVVIVGILAFATGAHTVSAKSVTEGVVQRAVVAPFDGFVLSAPIRAGDIVHEGDVLASLNDRDLVLDRLKARSDRDRLVQKHRDALAKHDRPEMVALSAQIHQSEAQLALAETKLARTRLTAPFDGIVVSGDLSQNLGSPVERGKVLFEIAPLDQYRVILQVDERDIGYVGVGQKGRLALAGLPGQPLPLTLTKITPVAVAEEGRNFFRIEASLDDESVALRPGMEGVGKIEVGRARLVWVWAHPLIEWLWLTAWKWIP